MYYDMSVFMLSIYLDLFISIKKKCIIYLIALSTIYA